MTATSPAPAPIFIPISKFQLYDGLPGRTNAYRLDKLGLITLTKNANGRVGVTIEEAKRFVSTPLPTASKRDTTKATVASLRRRGYGHTADLLEKRGSRAA